ncbi:MAG TPA: DNA-binding response regulator, partial [Ruminococcaceae bacterium]|nr:DNA-binding response regulator [Oscillospiraceae bacterium]
TKPFHPDELLARVGALTRRKGSVILTELSYLDIRLNIDSALLICGDESVQLSKKEFEVLKVFLYNPNMIITVEMLINKVWGADSEATDNNVEVYISFIRKKLKYLHSKVSIKKIQCLGYRLEEIKS